MGALAVPKLTVEEYLAADRVAEVRCEYHDGEVFPMVGATWQHGAIIVNVSAGLHVALKGTQCMALAASARLRAGSRRFFYPDLMVVCGQMAFADEREDTITNPKVVVEILSPASQDYDYGTKFASYRWLPSLEEYVLISQAERLVEVYRRAPDARWILSSYSRPAAATVPFESLGFSLPFDEIYAGVVE